MPLPSRERAITHHGPARRSGAAIYVGARTWERLVESASWRPEGVQAALLVGGAYVGLGGEFVEVRGYAEWSAYPSWRAFREELLRDWALITNRLRRGRDEDHVVGWVACEPGGRASCSDELARLHRTFFGLPFQLLLAVDVQAALASFYGPDALGRLRPQGFNLVVPL